MSKALITEAMTSHGLPFETSICARRFGDFACVSDGKFRFYILECESEIEFVSTSPTTLVYVARFPPVRVRIVMCV